MGVGVSFAVTAKLAHPQANVVLLTGDGAFLNGGLSIEVAFQEDLPVTVVVDNNSGLGSISQQQIRLFGQPFKTQFRDIPFHRLFEGLGGYGALVDQPDELVPALERAIGSGRPACVNAKTFSVASPLIQALTDRRAKASIE
jgi:acetolactate synthase-1/2/3 large subunit